MCECVDDIIVRQLSEILVERAQCPEIARYFETHHFVYFFAQRIERICRRHRNRKHQQFGFSFARGLKRRAHRCAGCNSVVDDDRYAAFRIECRSPLKVLPPPPLDFGEPPKIQ